MVCLQLNCTYDGLRFIPLHPLLESGTVLIWKKDQIFSPAVRAFLEYVSQRLEHAL